MSKKPRVITKKKNCQEAKILFGEIRQLIEATKTKIAVSVNLEVAFLNWKVGSIIRREILKNKKAGYGEEILKNLSDELIATFGSGWGEKHLRHCLRTAETFSEKQIVYALRRQLSWTHIRTISYEQDKLKRNFYLEMTIG